MLNQFYGLISGTKLILLLDYFTEFGSKVLFTRPLFFSLVIFQSFVHFSPTPSSCSQKSLGRILKSHQNQVFMHSNKPSGYFFPSESILILTTYLNTDAPVVTEDIRWSIIWYSNHTQLVANFLYDIYCIIFCTEIRPKCRYLHWVMTLV